MKAQTEYKKACKEGLASKLALTGGGVGLGLFAIYGIVNASFIGGIMGLNLAGAIMGFPVESAMLSRVVVALGMLSGVLASGLLFVMAGSTAGWVTGKVLDIIVRASFHKDTAHAARH